MSERIIPYTDEEDAIIINAIKESPKNVSNAINIASSLLPGRTKGGVSQRWYSVLSKKEHINVLTVGTSKGFSKNRKNLKRDEDGILPNQELRGHLFLLHQILELTPQEREVIRTVLNS